jgi:hypothetical protein
MSQRIRQLLDDAVSGLEPGTSDPVGAVLRRGRAARRRTVMAAATVAVLLVAGGVALNGRGDGTSAADAHPEIPYVDGDQVVAGDVRLPIPEGWRAISNDAGRPCGDLPKTILVIDDDNRGCQYASVEVEPAATRNPGGTVAYLRFLALWSGGVVQPPVSVTLRGGEPGWLFTRLDSDELKPGRPDYVNELLLPWSNTLIWLRTDGTDERKVIASLRSDPPEAKPLSLPDTAAVAELTVPDATGHITKAGLGRSTDPATITAVLELLREQTAVVDNDDACASDQQQSARLTLSAEDDKAVGVATNGARPSAPAEPAVATTVVIALGGKCQEAVSGDGGRVRLSAAALDRLRVLLGVGR